MRGIMWRTMAGVGLITTLAYGWQAEQTIQVHTPGVVEMTVPPALHAAAGEGRLDLRVVGPEGGARACEVFWMDGGGEAGVLLEPGVTTMEGKKFIWSAKVKARAGVLCKAVWVDVASEDYVGTVTVFGQLGGWKKLVESAAVYSTAGRTRTMIPLPAGAYEALRLEFSATEKRPVPLHEVAVVGERVGRSRAEERVDVPWTVTEEDGEWLVKGQLPGTGIWVNAFVLETGGQFSGTWSLETETVTGGRKSLEKVMEREAQGVGEGKLALTIPLQRAWPAKTFVVRLKPRGRYVGGVRRMTAKVHVPRVAFVAEHAGVYRLQTGNGETVTIQDNPTAARRESLAAASAGSVRVNPDWRPQDLLTQYRFEGAPFQSAGYGWRSAVGITAPGFYRVVLHQRGSLEGHVQALRVVRQGLQVPFYLDRGERQAITLSLKETFDQAANRTTWAFELPQSSDQWLTLRLRAKGLFRREVSLERDAAGPSGSPIVTKAVWQHQSDQDGELVFPLSGLPVDETRFRLVMSHGDNKPLVLDGVQADYQAPALYFLAGSSDGYEVYGDAKKAPAPQYDLQLVTAELMAHEPRPASLGEPLPVTGQGVWAGSMGTMVSGKWGFYAALALLTVGLVLIVVKLFPAAPPTASTEASEKQPPQA